MMRFASLSTNEPDLTNIQLALWGYAVMEFKRLDVLGSDEMNDFVVEAATILILAGASLTQLVGQNSECEGDRVPSTRAELRKRLGSDSELFQRISQFLDIYEDLRHFGEPKHENVASLDEESFLSHMIAIQDIWVYYLGGTGPEIGDTFRVEFKFSQQ